MTTRRLLIVCIAAVLMVPAACHTATHAATPCEISDPCGAEPASLPRLYLPAVMHGVRMTSEYTPAQPIVTPELDVPVTGDVQ